MLGLALSFGASGVVFADSEATAAVGSFVVTNSAASSESPQLPSVLNGQVRRSAVGSQGLTVYHTVEQGDSLWQIAQDHQVEINDIKQVNRISPDEPLQVGQVIKVPGEDAAQPTLVSLLPGVQRGAASTDVQEPSLERLLATLPEVDDHSVSTPAVAVSSGEATEPVVVATEELTGDVSLRSAGLVSQSDGLQADLQQLASRSQAVRIQNSDQSFQSNLSESDQVEASEFSPADSVDSSKSLGNAS
ncbi:MAG: LysM peptidoglycan-binding domain-containing protein, partial [Cyanobacteria bacterium P01_D01_bin.56]